MTYNYELSGWFAPFPQSYDWFAMVGIVLFLLFVLAMKLWEIKRKL